MELETLRTIAQRLRTLTKNVALDYAKYNIRVNSVHPGTIETRKIAQFTGDSASRE